MIRDETAPSVVARPAIGARLAGFDRVLLLFALLLTVGVLAYFWTPTDPDVWWHLRNGQVVATTGMVPQGDIYSYTVPGARWIMQQWLLETIMYGVEQALGYWANVLLFGLVTAGVYVVLFGILRAEGAGRPLAVAAVIGAMVLDAPSCGVRPQVWTTLFFVTFLALLLRYRRVARGTAAPRRGVAGWIGPDRRLWLLPPLMLLWANFHAGFSVGLLLLGAFVVGGAAGALLHRSAPPLRPLLAVTAACAAVSLLNPNGLDLWLYPITYLSGTGGNASIRFVQEWQPPDFRSIRAWPFAASLLLLLTLNLVQGGGFRVQGLGFRDGDADGTDNPPPAPRKPQAGAWADLSLMLALAGVTMMALQAIRFAPLYGVVWAVVLARRASDLWPGLGRAGESAPLTADEATRRALFGRLNAGVYVVAAGVLAVVMLGNPKAQIHAAPLERDYPAGAVAYLTTHTATLPQPLHLFHEYGWGGYLIAHDVPVFVDGRADPYNAILDDYVAAIGGVRWEAIFARYGVNGVLVQPGGALDRALLTASGWTLAYHDAGAVLYTKR